MEILIIAVFIGLIPAMIANAKGHNFFLWWLYGAAIWIVAFPHSLLLRPSRQSLDERNRGEGLKQCPACAEWVRPDAKVCKHCGRDIVVA